MWSLKLKVGIYGALLGVQLANAAYTILTSQALHSAKPANPLVFSFLRDLLAFPIIFIAALLFDGPVRLKTEDLPRYFCVGLFGMFGNQFLYILGMVYISPLMASVLTMFTPLCTWCLTTVIGLEPFQCLKLLGVVIAVLGAMLMAGLGQILFQSGDGKHSDSELTVDLLIGQLAVIGSTAAMAVYYIIQKPLLKAYPPLTVTAWSYFSGAAIMGLGVIPYIPYSTSWKRRHDPLSPGSTIGQAWIIGKTSWIALAIAVIVNSVLKYSLASFANKHVTATELACWSTLIPIFVGLAQWILGDPLNPWDAACIFVFIGMGMVTGIPSLKPQDRESLSSWRQFLINLMCPIIPNVPSEDPEAEYESYSAAGKSINSTERDSLLKSWLPQDEA